MSGGSELQKRTVEFLRRAFPGVKIPIACRVAVQTILGLAGRVRRAVRGGATGLPVASFGETDKDVFFGYYDLCPLSGDGTILLATRVPAWGKGSTEGQPTFMEVGFYSRLDRRPLFRLLGTTDTWCWQQGCRLQWYPLTDSGSSRTVLYNTMVNGRYGSVLRHLETGETIRSFGRPVYAATPDGKWGLSLDFSRLGRLRPGYGYTKFPDRTEKDPAPADNGIWRIDLASGKCRLLFSLADAADFHPLDSMQGAEHYFNHLLSSPTGERFLFLHLWKGTHRRYGRMITCDIDGCRWCLLNNEGHTSHYTWKNETHILAYATHRENGTGFFEYEDLTGRRRMVAGSALLEDGHPSYSPDKRWLLLDTYPDRYREQHLYLYDFRSGRVFVLGSFYAPVRYRGRRRCDLHPRWDHSGRYVSIDSAHRGRRVVNLIDVGPLFARIREFGDVRR